mmetsp:Transcript_34027/g.62220  ORF Transcript_34027/g.62220 Transcript_34027/m.62220 type:complete len:215 (-) Transcript_34027:150-794(-)
MHSLPIGMRVSFLKSLMVMCSHVESGGSSSPKPKSPRIIETACVASLSSSAFSCASASSSGASSSSDSTVFLPKQPPPFFFFFLSSSEPPLFFFVPTFGPLASVAPTAESACIGETVSLAPLSTGWVVSPFAVSSTSFVGAPPSAGESSNRLSVEDGSAPLNKDASLGGCGADPSCAGGVASFSPAAATAPLSSTFVGEGGAGVVSSFSLTPSS